MNKIINFGSINIDHVYRVDHFVQPGETLTCSDYRRFAGGKGLNQSIALANAGASVYHAGKLNPADTWLKTLMQGKGVHTRFVETTDNPTGHAVIQVNAAGENAIVIVGGANQCIENQDINRILNEFDANDFLLVQNEVSCVTEILHSARSKGLTSVFNPAPMTREVLTYPLESVDILIINETEAFALTRETDVEKIARSVRHQYPQTTLILTLGKQGAHYFSPQEHIHQPAFPVQAIDTTAAGDTFIGFFLAELIQNHDPHSALRLASQAAAICVTKIGAADSIPLRSDLTTF